MPNQTKKVFNLLLENAYQKDLSDLHLVSEKYPFIRNKSWDLLELKDIVVNDNETINLIKFKKEEIKEIVEIIWWEEWLEKFEENFELDTSYIYWDKARFRVNCYIDNNW